MTDLIVTPNTYRNFLAKVQPVGECIEWTGALSSTGYGVFGIWGKGTFLAHRLSYYFAYGPFISSLLVCHKCDNPKCVNPNHLFLGTHSDNAIDMVNKGRNSSVHKKRLTHCLRGHELSTENTRITKRGRKCRICDRATRSKRYFLKKLNK